MSQRRRVFFVSDRTGITVEALGSLTGGGIRGKAVIVA